MSGPRPPGDFPPYYRRSGRSGQGFPGKMIENPLHPLLSNLLHSLCRFGPLSMPTLKISLFDTCGSDKALANVCSIVARVANGPLVIYHQDGCTLFAHKLSLALSLRSNFILSTGVDSLPEPSSRSDDWHQAHARYHRGSTRRTGCNRASAYRSERSRWCRIQPGGSARHAKRWL